MDDIFSRFGDIFGGGFGGFSGFDGGSSSGRRVAKGANMRIRVKLSLSEIVNGVEKTVKIKKKVKCHTCSGKGAVSEADIKICDHCHGTGTVVHTVQSFLGRMQQTSVCPVCQGEGKIITNPCHECHGTGLTDATEEVSFKIPAGVQDGMQLTVQGKGNAAKGDGINGDLYVLIQEEEHPELQRDGNDLIYTLFLSIPDIVLGTSVEIPSADSKLKSEVVLDLGRLKPEDIGVEMVFTVSDEKGNLHLQNVSPFTLVSYQDGKATYQVEVLPERTGMYQVGTRFYPKNPLLPHRQDFPLVKWL